MIVMFRMLGDSSEHAGKGLVDLGEVPANDGAVEAWQDGGGRLAFEQEVHGCLDDAFGGDLASAPEIVIGPAERDVVGVGSAVVVDLNVERPAAAAVGFGFDGNICHSVSPVVPTIGIGPTISAATANREL